MFLKPLAFIKEDAFSQRMPPVQNIATFLFLSIPEDSRSFPYVIIDGEVIGGLVETAKFLVEKNLVSSNKK